MKAHGKSDLRFSKIFVDTQEAFVGSFDNDQLVCVVPITPGSKTLPAPVGTWKITGGDCLAIGFATTKAC